jgi:hypothetical protein
VSGERLGARRRNAHRQRPLANGDQADTLAAGPPMKRCSHTESLRDTRTHPRRSCRRVGAREQTHIELGGLLGITLQRRSDTVVQKTPSWLLQWSPKVTLQKVCTNISQYIIMAATEVIKSAHRDMPPRTRHCPFDGHARHVMPLPVRGQAFSRPQLLVFLLIQFERISSRYGKT